MYGIGDSIAGEFTISSKSEIALIRKREGKRSCPRCGALMPYGSLSPRIRRWAPFSHGWSCRHCPGVHVLDGNIDESENGDFRRLEKQLRIDLFSAIYKTSFSDKKQPENYQKKVEKTEARKREDEGARRKVEKYIDAVIRETSRLRPLEPVVDAPEDALSLNPVEE